MNRWVNMIDSKQVQELCLEKQPALSLSNLVSLGLIAYAPPKQITMPASDRPNRQKNELPTTEPFVYQYFHTFRSDFVK